MSTPVEPMSTHELERHLGISEGAGLGALGTARGNLPLELIDLRAVVTGLATRIELVQGFRNPYPEALEATYIFPLPDRAAVTSLRMEAGDRVVEGVLKERGEARADYEQAMAEGRLASIAEQERGDVFTLRVGNIMPGERVRIRLSLAGLLPFEDGAATFRFPLVVAPRYIPGAPLPGDQVGDGVVSDTGAVPDASRITPPVLLPGFPNPVRLTARVEIDPAGLPDPDVRSSLHAVVEEGNGAGAGVGAVAGVRVIRLEPGERANRDFVLRLHFGAKDVIGTSLAVSPDRGRRNGSGAGNESGSGEERPGIARGEGTFALMLVPPAGNGVTRPKDVALLLDRSGSMSGWKIVAARRAAARIIDSLGADDRFDVLTFDHAIERVAGTPAGFRQANDRNRFRAVEHLAAATARGGTEMLRPLREAVDLLAGEKQRWGLDRDRVLILVTDGQVGNEDQILHALAPDLGGIRVHTVGVDTAVHEGFLRSLAALGGGRCELVESEDRLDEAMRAIHHRIATPVVSELRVVAGSESGNGSGGGDAGGLSRDAGGLGSDADGLRVEKGTLSPERLPDLFPGAPLVITGRLRDGTSGSLAVVGRRADGSEWRQVVSARPADDADLAAIWARMRIRDLEDRYATDSGRLSELEAEITATSLRFNVLSRFTAFVAIDQHVVNEGGKVHRVVQPVELPQGWGDSGSSHGFSLGFAAAGGVGAAAAGAAAAEPMAPPTAAPMAAPMPRAAAAPRPGPVQPMAKRQMPEHARMARPHSAFGRPGAANGERDGALSLQPWGKIPGPLRAFVVEMRVAWQRLSGPGGAFAERREFLSKLGAEIDARISGYPTDGRGPVEPWLRVLRELVAELDGVFGAGDDPAAVQHCWLRVGDVFDALAVGEDGQPTGVDEEAAGTAGKDQEPARGRPREFWKR